MKYKILVVDDETANLRLLERLFRADYQVFTAASGAEGLELLKLHDFALILSDQRMPAMTGIEFLKRAAELRSQTIRIILTGYTDVNVLVDVINSGVVYKYIAKPAKNDNLQQTVRRAVEHYEASKSQYELGLQKARLESNLKISRDGLVKLVAGMLDLKDSQTHIHAWRTTGYAVALGSRLNLEPAELEELALTAYLHELEKLSLNEERNAEKSRGSSENFTRLLKATPHLTEIATALRYRHEHFDGGGTPEKLCAEQIPLAARIVAVADFYDTLTAPRHLPDSVSHAAAVANLQAEAGKRFDPSIVEKFAELAAVERLSNYIGAPQTVDENEDAPSADEMQTTAEILRRVKIEPLLAVEILRAANAVSGAPFAGLTAAVNSLDETELNKIVSRRDNSKSNEIERSRTARMVRCAVAAHLIAAHSQILDPEEAYTLGLLYNAGEIMLAELFPDKTAAMKDSRTENCGELNEFETFGVDAVQISRRLLESCGLSANSAAFQPAVEWMRIDSPAADLLCTAFSATHGDQSFENAEDVAIAPKVLETLKLSRAELDDILVRADLISREISR